MSQEHKSYEALEAENVKLKKELSSLDAKVQVLFSKFTSGASNQSLEKFDEKLTYIQDKLVQQKSLLDFSNEFIAICNEDFEFDFLNQAGQTLLAFFRRKHSKKFYRIY